MFALQLSSVQDFPEILCGQQEQMECGQIHVFWETLNKKKTTVKKEEKKQLWVTGAKHTCKFRGHYMQTTHLVCN